jgi:UDP-GlcNAc:undecaprenyl-phosphate GlcNAc-1-phosphate transferase
VTALGEGITAKVFRLAFDGIERHSVDPSRTGPMLTDSNQGLLAGVLAALLALVACRWIIVALGNLADRRDWVDVPGGRKAHRHPVPVVGGLAMMLSASLGLMLFDVPDVAERALMPGLLLVCAVGWRDDRRPVRASLRLGAHMASALLAAWAGGTMLHSLGDLFGTGPILLGAWALPVTVVAIAGIANAFNLIDGLDGLAGGIALVALGWFTAILMFVEFQGGAGVHAATLPLAFAGAVLGFLHFNRRTERLLRAEVFMGSAGSVMLGLLLAWLAVRTTQSFGAHDASPVVALWILAVPLFDTLSCMLRRLQAGVSPARPDRRHLHHLVLARSRNTRRAVESLVLLSFVSGAIGVIGWMAGAPEAAMFWTLVGLFVVYHVKACAYWKRVDRQSASATPEQVRAEEGSSPPVAPPLAASVSMQRVTGALRSGQTEAPMRGMTASVARAEARRDVEERAPS